MNNFGRAIIRKLEVKLKGQSVVTLDDADVFMCYQDLWNTTKERKNTAYQGIQTEAVRKIRIGAGDSGTAVKDLAIGTAFDNMFCIPLDFEMLSSHIPSLPARTERSVELRADFQQPWKCCSVHGYKCQ